jgi:nucleoside-diphosphate-sugar epimerase
MIRPDIFANGGDRKENVPVPEYEVCGRLGIQMVFNVGGGNPIRMNNLFELIQEISGSVLNIKFSDNQPGDPASTSADSSRIHRVLGWQKTTMLDEGLRAQFAAMNKTG